MSHNWSICPACGGKLIFNKENNSYMCEKCDTGFSEWDLEYWNLLQDQ